MDYIPIVDFNKLGIQNRIPSEEDLKSTAKEIYKALSGIGFVYLKNHGINKEIIEKAFKESKSFYELPDELKSKSMKDITKSYNGYAKPGQELLNPDSIFEIRESYDICGNLRYFPGDVAPGFESAIVSLEQECKPLIKQLLRLLAISLKLEDSDFFVKRSLNLDDLDIPTYTTFRTLYYPPTWDKNVSPGTVRCADHSDYGILTLLFQDSIGGLEVKSVNGKWVQANPIPDSVLVNTGDLLEFWSGGVFPATHHRVLIPDAELKQKAARQSIVYFVHPDDSALVVPLKESKNQDKLMYKPITAKDHAKKRLESSYSY